MQNNIDKTSFFNKPQGPQNMWLFLHYGFKAKRSGELRTPIVFMHFFERL